MDDAVTQTHDRASSLAEDAAHAAQVNTETQGKITTSHQKIDQTNQRLSEMQSETGHARGQVQGLQSAPGNMHAHASQLEEQGRQMIASSTELEQNLHNSQSIYAAGMASVPPVEYIEEPEAPAEGEVTRPG